MTPLFSNAPLSMIQKHTLAPLGHLHAMVVGVLLGSTTTWPHAEAFCNMVYVVCYA